MSTCQCGCGAVVTTHTRSNSSRGVRIGDPHRYLPGHNARLSAVEYVVDENGCWIWQRGRQSGGYGVTYPDGVSHLAHRLYYEKARGPIPPGMELDHLCRVRACVNPEHLEAVTGIVNCRRGARTKLTEDDVRAIRTMSGSTASIAARFGISESHCGNVKGRRSWGDVV